eukprot:364551-Chlamydomonas_euryale.AAC.1
MRILSEDDEHAQRKANFAVNPVGRLYTSVPQHQSRLAPVGRHESHPPISSPAATATCAEPRACVIGNAPCACTMGLRHTRQRPGTQRPNHARRPNHAHCFLHDLPVTYL